MKIVAIVQARMGSKRLPGKVLKTINGIPMIELLLARLSKSKHLDDIILAIPENLENNILEAKIKSLGYFCFRGSENNVLNRFYEAAKSVKADVITRITGDCPLIDPELVDRCIDGFKNSKVDYFSNTYPRSYPDGLDVSVMTFKSIEQANKKSQSSYDKEHISNYIINSREFLKSSLQNKENLSHLRWTVDNKCDLKFVESVFNYFSPNIYFKWNEILNFQKLIYEK